MPYSRFDNWGTCFAAWLALFTFSLGIYALSSREPSIVPIVLGIGYLGIVLTCAATVVVWKDIFHPLCAVIVIVLVRYGCPALLLATGAEPPEGIARFYARMKLSDADWLWAHALVMTSLAGIILGWFVLRGPVAKRASLSFSFESDIRHPALAGMILGFAALFVFIATNASLTAVVTGAMRNTEVEVGTGMYLRLAFLLIGGSILLSAYWLQRNEKARAAIPVIAATVALFSLGGRGRAMVALWAGLLLRWYWSREERGWPAISFRLRSVFTIFVSLVFATWVFYFGALYRGGYGLGGLSLSLSPTAIWQYVQYSIFADFGSLHAMAGAVAIGPGVLGGRTFLASLTWPLSKVFPIPGRSAGVYIVETLVGFAEEEPRWGLHASLMGDAYLNFGLPGVVVVMPLFGMILKGLYVRFRSGSMNAAIYAFAVVYALNLFVKSIDAWQNILTGLVFMWIMIRAADLLADCRAVRPQDIGTSPASLYGRG